MVPWYFSVVKLEGLFSATFGKSTLIAIVTSHLLAQKRDHQKTSHTLSLRPQASLVVFYKVLTWDVVLRKAFPVF